jgi:molybdate transport system substrate-binding protein
LSGEIAEEGEQRVRNLLHQPTARAFSLLWTLVFVSIVTALVLVALLIWLSKPKQDQADRLFVYCAAGIRVPVEEAAARYREEYGVEIDIQYGGSNTLLTKIDVNRQSPGDLYLAGDDFYTQLARDKGLAAERLPVAGMWPVLATKKGNPLGITRISDLLREDVRVAMGNQDQTAIGKAVASALTREGLWEAVRKRVTENGVFKPTVNEVANDIKIGAVDAGIVWNSTAAMPEYRDSLEAVDAGPLRREVSHVSACVLTACRQPAAALRFARYLTASDRGLESFAAYGFKPVDGDLWEEHPEITFFCGAVNRRAVDEVIKEFEQREGVTVNTVYNGCGILTGQMRTIRQDQGGAGFPDVYMACDRYYLENVKDWFQEDADVSNAAIVIAVPKGNPKKITGLADLTKEGMRVAVGQPEQCTIGALTRIMLQKMALHDGVMANAVTQTASSSMLIPSVVTKSADAAIAYVTDTKAENDKVDAVAIDSPFAVAIQPFALAKSSKSKYLGRRLFEKIAGAADQFEAAGFTYVYEPGAAPADTGASP